MRRSMLAALRRATKSCLPSQEEVGGVDEASASLSVRLPIRLFVYVGLFTI
jgi:hypothetical protein